MHKMRIMQSVGSFSVLLIVTSVWAKTPMIRMFDVKQVDPFGEHTPLLYEDGTISLVCHFGDIDCNSKEDYHFVDPNGHIVASNNCSTTKTGAVAYFDNVKVRNLSFGTYKCRYSDNEYGQSPDMNNLDLDYYICSDSSDTCMDSGDCDKNKFCVVTKGSRRSCSAPKSSCNRHNNIYHTLAFCGFQTLCHLLSNNSDLYNITYAMENRANRGCAQQPNIARLFDGVPYDAPVAIYESRPTLNYSCYHRIAYPLPFEYVVTRMDGSIIQKETVTCKDQTNISLNHDILSAGSQVYKITCKFSDGATLFSLLSNKIVLFASKIVIRPYPENNSLTCIATPPISSAFRVHYWWSPTSDNTNGLVGETLTPFDNKTYYQCHATLTYKSCSPHRIFVQNISSAIFKLSTGAIQRTTTSSGITEFVALQMSIVFAASMLFLCSFPIK